MPLQVIITRARLQGVLARLAGDLGPFAPLFPVFAWEERVTQWMLGWPLRVQAVLWWAERPVWWSFPQFAAAAISFVSGAWWVLAMVTFQFIIECEIKAVVRRGRYQDGGLYFALHEYGFACGDSMVSVIGTLTPALLWGGWWWAPVAVIPVIVGVARIAPHASYPLDIVGGWAVGAVWTLAVFHWR